MLPSDISMKGPFPAITGPTASGKTAFSLELADRLNAEIISADSRQIYRELTIGTAKPSKAELDRVPHHFIDELSLAEPFSAGTFAEQANERISDIVGRGRIPIVVGGSSLYLHALLKGLSPTPPSDADVRKHLEKRLMVEGAPTLFAELERADPISASALDPTKSSRLVRALEVLHTTGNPLSSYHRRQKPPPFSFRLAILNVDREILYKRIDERVDRMLDGGLLREVQHILDTGVNAGLNALKTIGYREPIAYLQGKISCDEMIRLIKRNTRRYAKRQLTWLRRYKSAHWIQVPWTEVSDPWTWE